MGAVLGIDFSTHAVDLCLLDEETNAAEWKRLDLYGATALARLDGIHAHMPRSAWYEANNVYLVAIEKPFGHRHEIGWTFGAIYSWVAAFARVPVFGHVPIWAVAPHEWKQGLGLPGNATKDDCAQAVLELVRRFPHSLEPHSQDALDAWAIAYFAREKNAKAINEQLQNA